MRVHLARLEAVSIGTLLQPRVIEWDPLMGKSGFAGSSGIECTSSNLELGETDDDLRHDRSSRQHS